MTNSAETAKVPAGPFRATMSNRARCGIIAPETKFQAGLRGSDYRGPRRIFFGEQTHAASMELFEGLQGPEKIEVEVSGYFKYQTNGYGETYLDERALFVEDLTVLV